MIFYQINRNPINVYDIVKITLHWKFCTILKNKNLTSKKNFSFVNLVCFFNFQFIFIIWLTRSYFRFLLKNVNGKILLVPKCTLKKMTLPSVWNTCPCKSLCVTQLLTICPITNRSLYINTKTKTFTYSTKTPPPIYVYPRSPLEN